MNFVGHFTATNLDFRLINFHDECNNWQQNYHGGVCQIFFMLLNNSSFSLQLVTATPMLLKFVMNRWPLLIPTTVFCMISLLSMHKGWLLHSHLNWANVILYALGKFTTGMEPWSASTDLNPIKVDLGLPTGLIK